MTTEQNADVIAIVGASGKTGSRVNARLTEQGVPTRGMWRSSPIPFDWADQSTWRPALAGTRAAYVTYYPDLAVPQAEGDIRAFTALALELGLEHVVLLSGRGEEGAQAAEQVLADSGLRWNVVRAGWFMENFSDGFMLDGLQAGELVLPEPKALEPFIDVDDIADVAVAALTRPELANQMFEVTGPALLSFDECVQAIAEASGRELRFAPVPADAYIAGAKESGVPDDIAWLMHELFVNVLDGRNEYVTDTVEQVLGRPARTFVEYVARVVPTGVWAQPQSVQSMEGDAA